MTIYLNFQDLNEDTQDQIFTKAFNEILNDVTEVRDIIRMYGRARLDDIARERAERKIYEYDYIFNV